MHDVESINLPKSLLKLIIEHAKKSAPYESVSILAGTVKEKKATVKEIFTPENIDHSTVTFSVDPLYLLDIYTDIDNKNLEVVGIFHTHPAPPYPSGTDKQFMSVNKCVWLISTTKTPDEPKGYLLLENGIIKNIEIIVTE